MSLARSISRALSRLLSWPIGDLRYGSGGSETALQQACIGAWDMQEPTPTDAFPQKGEITLTETSTLVEAFGSTGFVCRRLNSSSLLSAPSSEAFLLPTSGAKTFRYWSTQGHVNFISKGSGGGGPGDEYQLQIDGQRRFLVRARNATDTDGAVVASAVDSLPDASIHRCEVCFDADAGEIRLYAYDATNDVADIERVTSAPAGFNRANNDFLIERGRFCLLAIFNRALTTAEREADYTPTRYADLGK